MADLAPVARRGGRQRPRPPLQLRVRRLRRRTADLVASLPRRLRARLRRGSLARLPRGIAVLIASAWAAIGAAALAYAVLPQGFDNTSPGQWPVVVVLTCATGVLAAVVAMRVAAQPAVARSRLVVVVLGLTAPPAILAISAGQLQAMALGWLLVLAGVLLAALRPAAPRVGHLLVLSAVAAGSWLLVLLHPLSNPLIAQRPLLVSTFQLLAFGGLVWLSASAVRGVGAAIRRRHAGTVDRVSRRIGMWGAVAAVALAALVVVLRLTVLRGLFGELDAGVWALRGLSTWPHAILCGVLILVVAARSELAPLSRSGERGALGLITAGALAGELLFGVFVVASLLFAMVTGLPLPAPAGFVAAGQWVGLACVLALGWFLLPRYRGTLGRQTAVVALVYLLPIVLVTTTGIAGVVPTVWATPTQVAVVLVVSSAGLLLWRAVRRTGPSPHLLAVLALVPVLAVHAIGLIPAVVSAPFGRWTVLLGAVVAIVLSGPKVDADRLRRGRDLGGAAATTLAAAVALLASTALNAPVSDVLTTLAVLWLAVPTAVGLCCALMPRSADPALNPPPAAALGAAALRAAVVPPAAQAVRAHWAETVRATVPA